MPETPITQILRDYLGQELILPEQARAIGSDDSLLEPGLVSSLDLFRLVTFIEARFALQLDPADIIYENFNTLERMAALIQAQTVCST